MNAIDYFLNSYNWSWIGLLAILLLMAAYLLAFRTKTYQKVYFGSALGLLYLVLGSPVADLTLFGLHSVTMLQHIVLLMITPVLLLKAFPSDSLKRKKLSFDYATLARPSPDFVPAHQNHERGMNLPYRNGGAEKYYGVAWVVGAIAMWGGHFIGAAILSSQTGTTICGITFKQGSWVSGIPEGFVFGSLLLAGLVFSLPVFHPNPAKRLQPIQCVVYLFTACVSCSILGLYVAFSAASVSMAEALPVLNTFRNPVPMSVRTDQELAGMLMWVPGCILYVIASVAILLQWYDTNPVSEENETIKDLFRNKVTEL